MPSENVRERKKKRRFTLVFVPDAESEQPRTLSVNVWKLISALSAGIFGIVVLVAVILIYTPARMLFPVTNSEVKQQYGQQIAAIQNQVSSLYKELTMLRSYNLQLRKALGEEISPQDSNLVVTPPAEDPGEQQGATRRSTNPLPSAGKVNSVVAQQSRSNVGSPVAYVRSQQSEDKTIGETFPLTLPANGYVSRGFDAANYHYGIDLVSNTSSPILSAADGRIVFAGWTYDDGLMIIMAHSLGYVTVYKHNASLAVNTGATVKRGDVIALLGNTGKTSSGPHLHFEIWKDGIPYNPANYLLITQ